MSRYRLHDGDLLRLLMNTRADRPASVRDLASETGLSKSKIQALIDEDRPTVSGDEARRIAAAFTLRTRALFHPVSMSMDMDT